MSFNWVFSWSPWRSLSWVMPLLWVFQKNALSTVALCVCPIQSCCQVFLSCRSMFKGDLKKYYLYSLHSLCVSIFELVIWLLHSHHSRTMFWVSCRWCGTHHVPPSTRLLPSTSTHHLGNSLRNKFSTLRSICLNDIFYRSRHRLTSFPLIDRINRLFNIKAYIHTQYIVLGFLGNHWHQWWSPSHLLMLHIIDQ